jgi:glycosyltransferase involved in cell wall biosynthesis
VKLSVIIITKNEEDVIRECLESVRWADEIVVVDSFSTDKTLEICACFPVTIIQKEFADFGQQRFFSLSFAKGDWILQVDADERVPAELREEIQRILSDGTDCDGFLIPLRTFYLGKEIRHCGWDATPMRLFRRGRGSCDMRSVHEQILVQGRLGQMKQGLLHYSYRSIAQHIRKLDFYTDLQAKDFYKQGIRVTAGNIFLCWVIKPLISFFRKYILMKGFLEGREGFLISVFTAMAVFLNFVKLWELQKNESHGS